MSPSLATVYTFAPLFSRGVHPAGKLPTFELEKSSRVMHCSALEEFVTAPTMALIARPAITPFIAERRTANT
jgi:hypothetical protein